MAHLKKIDQNVPNDEQKVATSVLLYKVMLFKMPQKTPQHFAYFCKWKNVAKIFQVSAHTVSVTWARWMEGKQRFRARLRRRKWNYIYIRPLCHTIAAANCISCCCTLCVKRKPIHHRISIVVRVMRDVDLIRHTNVRSNDFWENDI